MSPSWPSPYHSALCLTLDNMGEAADLQRNLHPTSIPVGTHHSVRDVLPRLLALLSRYDVRVTYFIESWNLSVYPDAIRDVTKAGHEVGWHGWMHEPWYTLNLEAEKGNFGRSCDAFANVDGGVGAGTGKYRGFRPPGGRVNWHHEDGKEGTLELMKRFDMNYVSPAGDEAAVVDGVVVLPFRWTGVDAYYYMESFGKLREMKGDRTEEITAKDLAGRYKKMIDEVLGKGGFLSLLFHPFLLINEERWEALESVLEYAVAKREEGLWTTRCKEVADWVGTHKDEFGEDPGWDNTSWR